MLDVRLDRRGGHLRKLHDAEVRNEMLDPTKRIGQRLSLVDLIIRFDKLRSVGNAQILDDYPFTSSDGAFPKTKGVLRLLLVRCLRRLSLVQTACILVLNRP